MSTKAIFGPVRFSYVHVWEPTSVEADGEKKYSVAILVDKDDTKSVNAINAAIEAAVATAKEKLGGKLPSNFKMPLRNGDDEKPDDEAYNNKYFFNASSKSRPGIVDKNVKPILDREDFYSGCYGRASVNFYYFDVGVNRGIAAGLNNLQKLEDGDKLSGGATAEEDFGEFASADDDLM